METLQAIQLTIFPEMKKLNDRIAQALSSSNALMNRIIEGYLKTKGKQIRPIIVLLSAKMFGGINDNAIAAASAIELLHNATLIHDDVVDDSKKRRGMPTINSIWDNRMAVLVGDFFVAAALQQALSTNDIRIVSTISKLGKSLSIGEIEQIYNTQCSNITEKAYYETIDHKTASLFVSCVETGGYAAGADESQLAILSAFAKSLGLCFQIKDDIFDYFADEKIGKPTGNDLREGKITLPLLHVLLNENLPQHDKMLDLSRKENLDSSEISQLIDYAKENGGIDYAYSSMERLREEAVKQICKLPESETRQEFIDIFDYIITREF